jgi:glycosyltransferase involved in cell wall biosynthesis
MRILQVANGYPPAARGGVETYTQSLAGVLAARGHAVEVFCRVSNLHEPEYTLQHERVEGIAVRRVVNDFTDATQFEDHYRNARLGKLFGEHLAEFEPEVIHVQHTLGTSATVFGEAKSRSLPIVAMLHDFWYICPRANLYTAERVRCGGPRSEVDCVRCLGGVKLGWGRWLQKLPLYKWLLHRLPTRLNQGLRSRLDRPASAPPASRATTQRHRAQMQARTDYLLAQLRLARYLLTPSAFVKQLYAEHGLETERVQVLPLGVDLPSCERRPQSRPVIAYIGSLLHHKGPDLLVQAFRALSGVKADLRLYGAGDVLDVYADSLARLSLADDRIRLMGPIPRDRVAEALAETDLLVIPSRVHETYSLAAREALRAGVPVIATRLGALPEVIEHGISGFLVPPDDANALSQSLSQALARLPELQAGARASRPAPTLDEHVTALESLYRNAHLVR